MLFQKKERKSEPTSHNTDDNDAKVFDLCIKLHQHINVLPSTIRVAMSQNSGIGSAAQGPQADLAQLMEVLEEIESEEAVVPQNFNFLKKNIGVLKNSPVSQLYSGISIVWQHSYQNLCQQLAALLASAPEKLEPERYTL